MSPGVSTVINDVNIYTPSETEIFLYPHLDTSSVGLLAKKILLNSRYGSLDFKKELKDMIGDKKKPLVKKITKVNLTKLLQLLNRFSVSN